MAYDTTQFFLPTGGVNPDYVNPLGQKVDYTGVKNSQWTTPINWGSYAPDAKYLKEIPGKAPIQISLGRGGGFVQNADILSQIPQGMNREQFDMFMGANLPTEENYKQLWAEQTGLPTSGPDFTNFEKTVLGTTTGGGYAGSFARDPTNTWAMYQNPGMQDQFATLLRANSPTDFPGNTALYDYNKSMGYLEPTTTTGAGEGMWESLMMMGVKGALATAGGVAGGAFLGPALGAAAGTGIGAGATSGFIQGAPTGDPWGGALKGGIVGGITGAIGGQVAKGLTGLANTGMTEQAQMLASQEAGFSPLDLAGWGGATTTGLQQPLINMASKGIKNTVGSTLGTALGTNQLSNMSSSGTTPTRTTTGGTMATTGTTGSGMNLQDLSNMLTPLLGMYSSNKQGNQMNTAYGQGVNMMTTPSSDQQFYRTELQKMFTDPSSFYEGEPYKAAFGQGQQATERALNAQGLAGSGAELAELQKYGQTFGWDQMMKQADLFGKMSGVSGDAEGRSKAGTSLINQGQKQADVTGAMSGDVTKGLAELLRGGDTGSNLGGTTLSSLLQKANSWFPSSSTNSNLSNWGSFTPETNDLGSLLAQQDGFNWSGLEGVIGGSEQDMMLNDQWDWSW